MRKIFRIEVKNEWVVKGKQYEGVRKVCHLSDWRLTDQSIEELFVVDLTRSVFGLPPNYDALSLIADKTLLPVTFGGGIVTVEQALKAFELGADRVYLNTAVGENSTLLESLAELLGRQAVVVGCEYRFSHNQRLCYGEAGRIPFGVEIQKRANMAVSKGAGEIVCASIDNDGLENGFDYNALEELDDIPVPLLISGGGNESDYFRNDEQFCEGKCFSSFLLKSL